MSRLIAILCTVLALGALLVQPAAPPAEAATNCSATPTNPSDPQIAQMWTMINNARAIGGKPALQWSTTMAQSASWMARDSAARTNPNDPYNASAPVFAPVIDTLGRDARARLTDCGYRQDAAVGSSTLKVTTDNPAGAFTIWGLYDNLRFYRLLHDIPDAYTVGALGYARSNSFYPYFWVLDVGTQPDASAPNPTPVPPTATPIPPTQTPFPTARPTPMPTPKPRSHFTNCTIDAGAWPGPIDFSCDE